LHAAVFWALSSLPLFAYAQAPSADKEAIDRRLVHEVENAAKISIQEGDTIFLERKEHIPASRLTKKASDYEGIVTGIVAPKNIVVHQRIDEVKLEPDGVTFRYAIHVEPGASSGGGRVQLTLNLIERTGLANTIKTSKQTHVITITPAKSKASDLALDFAGYRLYHGLAKERIEALAKKGVTVSIADQAKLPSLEKLNAEGTSLVLELDRWRRRAWIAHRHLIAARSSKDEKIASAAKAYLANLDKPDSELSGIPQQPQATQQPQGGGEKTAPVETLKPVAVEPVSKPGEGKPAGSLAPVSSYEQGSEGEEEEVESQRPAEKPKDKPAEKAATKPVVATTGPAEQAKAEGRTQEASLTEVLEGKAKEIPIPTYPRALIMDDPNVAYGGGVRIELANVKGVRGTSGTAPAIFYEASAAVTRFIGVDLTVPTALVSIDVQRAQSTYTMGNPLLSAKYRFNLPELGDRQPVLSLRGRWAIPIQPRHFIPPTDLGAEDFSMPAHFADTSAFLLAKTAVGLGFNAAWQASIVMLSLQAYSDYFFPVKNADDQTAFFTLSYGASVGVLPFGDVLGIFLEGRSASLLTGPRRTEFFTYLGARAHFADLIEPSVWLCLPVGSVNDATGLQIGFGLHVMYDVADAVTIGKSVRQDQPLLE
jgi:hypothetical protein